MARSPELARLFQQPDLPAQRPYEICRAYFHEAITADEIAQQFHLHVGSVRAIVCDFARDPDVNAFFAASRPGRKTSPKRDAIHQRACELRRQGATLADIHAALQREGFDVSESYLFRVLRRAGLAATRQGRPLRQPGDYANDGSLVPDIADVRALALEDGRQFSTQVAGLFLFLPLVLDLDLPQAVTQAGLPGSEQIPPLQALLASNPSHSEDAIKAESPARKSNPALRLRRPPCDRHTRGERFVQFDSPHERALAQAMASAGS